MLARTEGCFMNWWWLVADILLIAVVAPTVVYFLNKVYRPVKEIQAYAHDILEHGVLLTGTLDAVPKLGRTRELTAQTRDAAGRYVSALARLV
ncbi:MAG TPA: hypothetical protein VM390_08340 [Acidimicrobiales bacterium]|nr:hypothetical protein [Acidimicrobiales bacterium]